jgi:hypothetical protein
MNLYIGKTVARCKHCGSTDWLLVEPAGRFSILSDVVCAACKMKHTYADLVLQLSSTEESPAVGGGLQIG